MANLVATYLAHRLKNDNIERRALTGAKDRGDITGVRTVYGRRVVVEVKDYGGRLEPGPWLNEAERERQNDGAAVGVVVAKRRGTTNPADQFALMRLADLAVLLGAEPET